MRAPTLIAPLLLAAAIACEKDPTEPTPPTTPNSVAIEQLEAERARSICALLFRCDASLYGDAPARLLFRDAAECTTYLRDSRTFDQQDLEHAVAAGLVRYDGAAAARCLRDLDRCEALSFSEANETADCKAVFAGTVAAGGACQRSEECAGDAYCASGSGSGQCPGTCVARLSPGSACQFSLQCATMGTTGRAACIEDEMSVGACLVLRPASTAAAEGAACGIDRSTSVETACAAGLYCHRETGRCARPVAAGASCDDGDRCVAPSYCTSAVPGGPRTCHTIEILRTAGATCDERVRVCSPLDGLECGEGTCVDDGAPAGPAGSPCSRSDHSAICDPGLFCGGEGARTCRAQVALGQPCDSRAACATGICERGMCAARDCLAL